MHPNGLYQIPASLDVYQFSPPPGELDWLCCPRCSAVLHLHQPEPECPDRLLGVCGECKRWFLINLTESTAEALMVLLPENGWVRSLLSSPPANNSPADTF